MLLGGIGMTEKITITQEQANEVAKFTAKFGYTPIDFHRAFRRQNIFIESFDLKIAESIQDSTGMGEHNEFGILQKLYAGDYEIGPEYKVGDWIVNKDGSIFLCGELAMQVTEVRELFLTVGGDRGIRIRVARHATPEEIKAEEERRKWAKVEPGDVIIETTTGRVGILTELKAGFAEMKQEKGDADIKFWNTMHCELYAKKVRADD